MRLTFFRMQRRQPTAAYARKETTFLGSRKQSNATRQCTALSGAHIAKKTKFLGNRMQQDNAQPSAAYTLPRKRNPWAIACNKTMRSPQRRTHCQENEIPGQSDAIGQSAALSGVRTATKTKCWAVGCYEDTAQPTAAYALPRKRNSWAIGCNQTMRSPQRRTHCQENEMLSCRMLRRQCAAPSGALIAKKTKCLWAIGCNKTMRSPQRRTHCHENEFVASDSPTFRFSWQCVRRLPRKRNVGLSDATKTLRSPQRRTHCQENKIPGQSVATRQCAALSGARIAKKTKFRGNRMQRHNAEPSAAYALPRKRNVGLSDATKTLRSPQRRTHCQENEIPGQSDATRPCAALSGVRIVKQTKCWAVGCYADNAQPPAAHSLPRKRNAWAIGCCEDTAQPTAAYALPRKRNSWAIGCNQTTRSPQRRTHCQANEMLGCRMLRRQCAAPSGALIAKKTKCLWAIGCNKTMRSPQRRTHCQEIEMLGSRMLLRQRAARMHCNATKFLGNRMQQDNAQPSAAYALPRKRYVGLSDATKTLRSPQRRTH